MTDREHTQLTPEEESIRREIRELSELQADSDFRERLLQDFVSGAHDKKPAPPPPKRSPRGRWWRGALVPACAAALFVVVMLSQGPPWSLLNVSGDGEVVVNGTTVSANNRTELARLIGPRAQIQVSEGVQLQLVCPNVLLLQITSNTEMTVPQAPRRWFKGKLEGWVNKGEILIKTGPGFPGQELLIQTSDGRIVVSGTTISVYKGDDFTCVCVLTGQALIGKEESTLEKIPSGMRKVMFADGRPPLVTEIAAEHKKGLLRFESEVKGLLRESD
jgi:ferric-dicitrate binding protein FerR (iron transport regulator)